MPLFVNGEFFNHNLSVEEQPSHHKNFKKDFDTFKEEMRNLKDPVTLRIKRNIAPTDSIGQRVQGPSTNIPYRVKRDTPTGSETWVYQDTFPSKNPSGDFAFKRVSQWVRKQMSVPKNQADKLFFLMEKSGFLGYILDHHDPAAIARKRKQEQELRHKFEWLMFNEDSDFVKDRDKMKDLARAYKIRNTDTKSFDEVQMELYDTIDKDPDKHKRKMRRFVEECYDTETIGRKVKIQRAIEKGYITFNTKDLTWMFAKDGKPTAEICTVDRSAIGGGESDALVDYLKRNPKDQKRLFNALKTGRMSEYIREDVDNLHKDEIKREAKILGLKVDFVKYEDVVDSLKNELSKE